MSLTLSDVTRCKAQYGGRTCDECNNGYYLYPQCVCKYPPTLSKYGLWSENVFGSWEQVLLVSLIGRCQGHHMTRHHKIWEIIFKDGHPWTLSLVKLKTMKLFSDSGSATENVQAIIEQKSRDELVAAVLHLLDELQNCNWWFYDDCDQLSLPHIEQAKYTSTSNLAPLPLFIWKNLHHPCHL